MKTFTFTFALTIFIGLIISNACNAQTHRLLSQIEETKLGNNIWDKVTVLLPNKSYELNKVSCSDNTLLILFDYAKTNDSKQTYFTLNLSNYDIDCQNISERTAFQVIAKPKGSILGRFNCPPNCLNESGNDPILYDFRCPASCPLDINRKNQ